MKKIIFALLAACSSSPTMPAHPDGSMSQVDAAQIDAIVEGDAAQNMPHAIVPAALGGVRDFAYTATDVYPIVNIGGHMQLVRCPIAGCSTSPQVIGASAANLYGQGVAITGTKIYWLASQTVIMQANLDGTGATTRYEFLEGQIEPPLRADAGSLYFNYHPPDFHTEVMTMSATGTTAPHALAGTQLTTYGFSQELAVGSGKLVYWHDIQGTDPQPIEIYDLAGGTQTMIAASADMSELVLADHGIAWVESTTNHSDVRACLLGSTCSAPPMGPPTFVALAAVGDHVYFSGRAPGNLPTIVTCSVQDLAATTCDPQPIAYPGSVIDLLNTRVIEADAHAVWVGTDPQGAASLWRIDL